MLAVSIGEDRPFANGLEDLAMMRASAGSVVLYPRRRGMPPPNWWSKWLLTKEFYYLRRLAAQDPGDLRQ